MVLTMVLAGTSIAAFLKYNISQSANNDARDFITELTKDKTAAASLHYPTGCTTLKGVTVSSVTINNVLNGITVTSLCDPLDIQGEPVKILGSSIFSDPFNVTFLAGTGYLSAGMPVTIKIINTNDQTVTKTITISTYGVITSSP